VELSGSYTFAAPRTEVWDALMDPEVLAKMLPGTERLDKVGDNSFEGVLNVRVGPVQGRFKGVVSLIDLKDQESFRMEVEGRGPAGFVRGGGDVVLTEVEDAKTVLSYQGTGDVGGRIASVGQRLVETSAKSILRQGLESLDRIILARQQPAAPPQPTPEAPGAAAPQPAPTPEINPPSELEVTLRLAQDIFAEYVPAEQRPYVVGGLATLSVVLVLWLLRKLFCHSS